MLVATDLTVSQGDDPPRHVDDFVVVGGEEEGHAFFFIHSSHQSDQLGFGF